MGTELHRIVVNPLVMGGKPCVRGTRITVGTVVGLLASGHPETRVLELYPSLKFEDVRQCLAYAAWRSEEQEMSLAMS